MDQLTETAVKAIADLTRDGNIRVDQFTPPDIHGIPATIPVLIDAKTGAAKSLKPLAEEWREKPATKRGVAQVTTLESFIDLTNRHKTDDSVIFADTDWQKPSLVTVIDYHQKANGGTADNGRHRVLYEFPRSEEWEAWSGIHNKPLDQTAFAEFIEDHIADLSAPDTQEEEDFQAKFSFKVAYPNELVALSRGLAVHTETRVKSNLVLQSGEGEITWDEQHNDAQGNKLKVPGMFILQIPAFHMGAPMRIPVRLRYRVRAGSLSWTVLLYRPDVFITQEVLRNLEAAASETELPKFVGAPEMAA
ncbi:DUF2303 family protein [Neorhizobium galegae]|uniref:DUF2303 family protein n=1 Tax=Neorhizobium galegae TaxID=399 RepID=A0A6A1TPP0_NEOGA|nr:DUF2303 family protein [Neorhizobium galegae]KAB1086398.1 DUF2303 family protein [Neorhizobium galegae]